jgi:RNA polymerase sigma factor FliA
MPAQPVPASQNRRIVAGLPFVESLARRMASSMPNSIDIGDLVQDGMLGLIDAAHRFDEARGIKFETFAERRVRGAMIDALRRDAWPRGVRRQRRELDAAREALRRELGHEPSMADLAARVGSDEKRLSRMIVRINTIEATSPLATGEHFDESCLPTALVPSEPDSPHKAYEKLETRQRIRVAITSLPWRERKVIGLYYYGEVTMKEIGAAIGVNESRVSQLHARAIRRLREALGAVGAQQAADMRTALLEFAAKKPVVARAKLAPVAATMRPEIEATPPPAAVSLNAGAIPARPAAASVAVVLPYQASTKRRAPVRAVIKTPRSRQAVAAVR